MLRIYRTYKHIACYVYICSASLKSFLIEKFRCHTLMALMITVPCNLNSHFSAGLLCTHLGRTFMRVSSNEVESCHHPQQCDYLCGQTRYQRPLIENCLNFRRCHQSNRLVDRTLMGFTHFPVAHPIHEVPDSTRHLSWRTPLRPRLHIRSDPCIKTFVEFAFLIILQPQNK